MEPEDQVGPGAAEVLVAPFQIGAAEIRGGEGDVLEGRAGGAVHDQDPLVERGEEGHRPLFAVGGLNGDGEAVLRGNLHRASLSGGQEKTRLRHRIRKRVARSGQLVAGIARDPGRIPPRSEGEGTLGVRPRLPSPVACARAAPNAGGI